MRNSISTRSRRRIAAGVAALALTAGLTACSGDDGDDVASDPAPSDSAPAATESTDDGTEGGTEALPEWAPEIVTEGDLVTGLDFSNAPADPPAELEVATVIEGDGPPVEQGQTITANYFGAVYGEDVPFDESYSSQPFQAPIGVGSLIQGWDETIPGVPVGSRIIMSIPSDLGYGDGGTSGIPGGSTLVFVIDIVDAA